MFKFRKFGKFQQTFLSMFLDVVIVRTTKNYECASMPKTFSKYNFFEGVCQYFSDKRCNIFGLRDDLAGEKP